MAPGSVYATVTENTALTTKKTDPTNLKKQKKTKKYLMEHGPKSIKIRAKIIKNRCPDGPGGLPGEPREPFWSPKLPRAEK